MRDARDRHDSWDTRDLREQANAARVRSRPGPADRSWGRGDRLGGAVAVGGAEGGDQSAGGLRVVAFGA